MSDETPSVALARPREGRLIAAMLANKTLDEAAKAAGISRRMLFAVRQDPGFQARYQAADDELLRSTVTNLRSHIEIATKTLVEIAQDPKQNGNARVRASEVIWNTVLKAIEIQNILPRLEALEAAAKGAGQ